ncbi:hypothetical protein ACHEVJ_04110 [Enterococcus raffinosus]|uniref:Uncharacterized protein n=1 Tax=Enterococcus raffinosus TaxID=71452 RepID=A0AAW8SZD6_9ENTE|nr:hypothetical protein [Enterococcus raffinosus]MDK7991064.1 hypothetical protein [Enterococcus raffinosus]MDT2539184.1 hypothetical protein [Enterococcus raffinosus]MDT2573817.1 hypothetical protein [Enterococcus raffinosus]UXJ97903.1 hypothetical protein N7K39_16370 [Enterococcus raffinosus]
MLHSQDACDRTIAAKLLPLDCETTDILLHSLMTETALYTRLAMTEKLEGGDSSTALKMIGFLGKIGKNQHRIPIAPSKKKSFPLLRDLMARSLGRMNPELFPVLLASAEELPPLKLSELIDAIGYMAFYHPALATAQNYQRLLQIKNSYDHDPLIQWKCLICFSAFPQSKDLLAQEDQFSMEAQRSLSLLALKKD